MSSPSWRVVAVSLALLIGATVAAARGRFYRGPRDEPAAWTARVERAKIVEEARGLRGILYDPLQGLFGDWGGRLGLIVCMDVPVIAYRNAGASLRRLLEEAHAAHPEYFDSRDGRPGDPFFHRRARNLYAYCRGAGRLRLAGSPKPGDVIFFSRGKNGWISHIALVSSVDHNGRCQVVEASRDYLYVTREVPLEDVMRRGWVNRGYGDVLTAP